MPLGIDRASFDDGVVFSSRGKHGNQKDGYDELEIKKTVSASLEQMVKAIE